MVISCQDGQLPGANVREKLRNAKKFGYDGVEVQGWGLKDDPVGRLTEYKREAKTVGVKITAICSGNRGCFLAPDPVARREARESVVELMGAGHDLGGAHLIHVPVFGKPQVPDLGPWKSAIEIEDEMLVTELKAIAPELKGMKSRLLLEPLNRYETHYLNTTDRAVALAKRVGSPNVRIMADVFHMNIEETDIAAALERNLPWIDHVHFADSTRKEPGSAHTDFKAVVKTLAAGGFAGAVSLECGLTGPAEKVLPQVAKFIKDLAK